MVMDNCYNTAGHYNYYRTYDPATGRYITADPIGMMGGPNLFLYANANPIVHIDPLGLIPPGWWEENMSRNYPPGFGYPGPFGGVCGPQGTATATWIPDIYRAACELHDQCYDDCSKTKRQCDDQFRWITGGGLGSFGLSILYDAGATRSGKSQEQYDKAREKCQCQ